MFVPLAEKNGKLMFKLILITRTHINYAFFLKIINYAFKLSKFTFHASFDSLKKFILNRTNILICSTLEKELYDNINSI